MQLLDLLAKKDIIARDDIEEIRKEAAAAGGDLRGVLLRRGVDEEEVLGVEGESYGIPTRHLGDPKIPFDTLKIIPEESAIHYRIVPLDIKDGVLEVGVVDPENIEARDVLNFISSKNEIPFKIFLITESDFNRVLELYRGLSGEVTKALGELESELSQESIVVDKGKKEDEKKEQGQGSPATIVEDAPVTKIVATILHYAVEGSASDVHIEHLGEKIRVRFRVDGELHTSLILPPNVHSSVVARIKILSTMRLDEKRKPQDGRFSARISGRKIDFRVSTFPAYYGEKVVMRILDAERGGRKLDELGLSKQIISQIKAAIERPYGLILISGPTGSGKTTTLYSMLGELDREQQNVLSLEDPVEYSLTGVNQSQVRPEIGYTFANGLRTTLRQDPDVIMVGEIRDSETAKLAIQAALTGHLVFSTIHTNDAVGVIPRLINMGVEPYLIGPTLILTLAQRLVRTLCPGAGKKIPIEGSMKMMIEKQFSSLDEEYREKFLPKSEFVYEASSTPECPDGTRGRVAVMEAFTMDDEVEDAILKGVTDIDLGKLLRKRGMISMREDAIIKSMEGKIPFSEVNNL